MKKIVMTKNTNSKYIVRRLSLLTIFFSLSFGSSNIPPSTDYCEMLEKDINGIQHGFLAGNKMYYVGGQSGAYWDGIPEYETIGLTHPFFRDMRSRGYGMTKTEYGFGNDKWGWEFYRLTKGAYGTVIHDGKEYKHPKPENLIWRPDRQITKYNIDGIEIVETKFISLNDVVCSIIKSSEPIKIRFNGTGFYNPMNLPTFDGDEDGIPWQQNIKSNISFRVVDNAIQIYESSDMMVKPNWGKNAILGKMMYDGMSVVISSTKSIQSSHNTSYDKNKVPNYDFTIDCDSSGVGIFYSIGDNYEQVISNIKKVRSNVEKELEMKTTHMNKLLNEQIPYFRCSDQAVVETYYYLWAIYFMYFIDVGDGYMEYPHTQTAINNFMGLHLWDSSVYARMGSWVADKWQYGFGNVLNWKNLVPFKKEGGRLPDNFGIDWYSPVWFTPVYTIPGAWMMYEHSGDKKFLRQSYGMYHDLYKDGIKADPAITALSASTLKSMAKVLKKKKHVKLWNKIHSEAVKNLNDSWEVKSESYYGNYDYQGKDIWHLAALMSKDFPDDWARDLTDSWIMDTEEGFLGPVALDVRAKSAVQNGIFEVSTISTWQVIEGMFENNIDKEAVHITLSHLNGMYRDYEFPIAPEVWTPEYKPWGSMYYNWDGAIVLPIIKRLAGFDYSFSEKTISISDHLPPSWDYIDLMVPVSSKINKVEWVDLSMRREQTKGGITKNYSVNNLKGWTLNINPWYEDRKVIDVITTMKAKNKNDKSQLSYYINNQREGSLQLKLGKEYKNLKNRILVSPESRTFINDIKIELRSLMGNGKISYKTPSSSTFIDYLEPFYVKESGVLVVKVLEDNIPSSDYEITFFKQKPLPAIDINTRENGLKYKYYEGNWNKIPDFENEAAIKDGFIDDISSSISNRKENYGLVLSGNILVPEEDIYTFYLRSNDGSRLKIGGKIVSEINGKAGLDPIFAAPSRIALSKGFHSFEIEYFQSVTRNSLFVEIESSEIAKQVIPASMLFK